MRYHLKCCVIVNALIECKIAFFKVVRQSLKSFYLSIDFTLKYVDMNEQEQDHPPIHYILYCIEGVGGSC